MKSKSLFSRLLENKKLVLIFSFAMSFVFWIITSDNIVKSIPEIKIEYQLSDSIADELKVFSSSVEEVYVTVSGKRVAVDSLDREDFRAYVDLRDVTDPVTKTFKINVESTNPNCNIEKIEPSTVELTIDREESKIVELLTDFTYKPEGKFTGEFDVDNNAPDTVEISGPKTEVDRIKSALIKGDVNSPDALDVESSFIVKLYNNESPLSDDAEEVTSEYLKINGKSTKTPIKVSFTFLKFAEDVSFKIKSSDDGVKLSDEYFTIYPSSIDLCGPEGLVNDLKNIELDIGTLAKFNNSVHQIKFSVSEVLGEGFVNKSDFDTVSVTADFSSLDKENFTVPSTSVKSINVPSGYRFVPKDEYTLTVIGTVDALSTINPDKDFSIVYNFPKNMDPTISVEVPVTVSVKSNSTCWVYRKTTTASIKLEKIS